MATMQLVGMQKNLGAMLHGSKGTDNYCHLQILQFHATNDDVKRKIYCLNNTSLE